MVPTMRRLVLGLNAATVLLVAAGILLLVLPARVPASHGPPTVVASTGALTGSATAPPAPDLTAADRFVRTDIFSARRSPPPRRYMLGDTGTEVDAPPEMTPAAPLGGEPMDSTSASTAADPVPHLYGTMLGPVDATALLRLDARVSEPRLYRVGDRAGGFRVDQIAERSVTLVGPGGRVVLRLSRPDQ